MVRRTKEEAQETRNRILDAAEVVFHLKGVSRASLADLAAQAGVTRGAIYWHFKNKLELFDAMVQRVLAPVEAKLAQLQEREPELSLEAVRSLVLYFLEQVENEPRVHRAIETSWHKCEHVGEMARMRDLHLECGNRHLDVMTAALRAAQQRGELARSLDPRHAALGLMALVDGLVVNWTLDREAFALSRIAAGVVDAYLAGLKVGSAGAVEARNRDLTGAH